MGQLKKFKNHTEIAEWRRKQGLSVASRRKAKTILIPLEHRPDLAKGEWKSIMQKDGKLSNRTFAKPPSRGVAVCFTKIESGHLAHIAEEGKVSVQYFCPTSDHRRLVLTRARSLAKGDSRLIMRDKQAVYDKETMSLEIASNQLSSRIIRVRQGRLGS
jgi:hypothetical protein